MWTAYSERFERNGILADLDAAHVERRRYRMLIFLLAVAFGILQVCLAGYSLGVGNQTIQIPYLKYLINPQLYAQDPAVIETINYYPSYAYKLLAYICVLVDYQIVYAVLHIVCSACLFGALLYASYILFGELWSGIICSLMVLIGQHHALAGADIYSIGFTHTWLSIPWMMWCLVIFWQQRHIMAGLLLGLLFNIHALHAAYAAVFIAAMSLAIYPPRQLWRLGLIAGVAFVCALPTLIDIVINRQTIGDQWWALMEIRSAHHSFPIHLWEEGDGSIARFAQIVLFGALALPFVREPFHRRMAVATWLVFMLFLLVGFIGTSSVSIVKAQLWRSSGLMLLLVCLLCGHGIFRAWREKEVPYMCLAAVLSCSCICAAIPGLQGFLYVLLSVATLLSLWVGSLTWRGAACVGALHICVLLSYFYLSIPLFTFSSEIFVDWTWIRISIIGLSLLCILGVIIRIGRPNWPGFVTQANLSILGLSTAFLMMLSPMLQQNSNAWLDLQNWVKFNTEKDALIASPSNRSGFRIHAERSIVGEWRDGTQLYFMPDYADQWRERMSALQLGLRINELERNLEDRGRSYIYANDEELLALADNWKLNYLVLPSSRPTELKQVYHNQQWQLCVPEVKPPPPTPDFVKNEELWQAQKAFVKHTIEPNIQRYRKRDFELRILDADGKPLQNTAYALTLQKHDFGFGAGLPFFKQHKQNKKKRFVPPIVKDTDLEHFKQVFNWSTIPYSAKWFYTEPVEGQRFWDDLDAYVEWCAANNVDIEYHFVTGYYPQWLKKKDKEGKQAALLKHTNEIIDRYGEHIKHWQVVNEKHLLRESVKAFQLFRERMPEAKLGISDCARFYTKQKPGSKKRNQDLLRGMNEVKWLRKQGVELDFFAFHGHRPFGLYADLNVLYETLDAFQDEGLRVHISEFGMHVNKTILGDVRGGQWNADLQGEYYALIYKACFSHPTVDVINMWGTSAQTWMTGSGIVDKEGKPKPAFFHLKKLIHEELHSHEQGTVPIHGRVKHNVFYGDYELVLSNTEKKDLRIPLILDRQAKSIWEIKIDPVQYQVMSVEAVE